MKRNFCIMAALAAMIIGLTACSDNFDEELKGPKSRNIIGFTVNTDGVNSTRGDATSSSNILFTDFQTWAYDAVTDVLYMGTSATAGREVEYSAGVWGYSPQQFWPVNPLAFVAIAPHTPNGATGNTTTSTSGVVTLVSSVTLDTEVENQDDIMFAASKDNTPTYGPVTIDDYSGNVPLAFQHALSQIVFKGKLPSDGTVTKVEIAEITLGNIGKTGDLTFTSTGTFFGGTNAYISTSSPDKFTLDADDLKLPHGGINLTKDGIANATGGTAFDLTVSNSANNKHNAWLMLPQHTPAWAYAADAEHPTAAEKAKLKAGGLYSGSVNVDPAAGAYLKIRAKLSKDGVVIIGNAESDAIYIPLDANWDRSKKYIYTIEFNGLAALTPITFSVTAEDWTTATFVTGAPDPNGHEYVDLGLPSGTLWATVNIGAADYTKTGNYYMYGKGTTVYNSSDNIYTGIEVPLDPSVDTATLLWGGDWHIPTLEQIHELENNCIATGEGGYSAADGDWEVIKYESRLNGNSIRVRKVGYYENGTLKNASGFMSMARFWSSTPNDNTTAYCLNSMGMNGLNNTSSGSRSLGIPIRPVLNAPTTNSQTVPF